MAHVIVVASGLPSVRFPSVELSRRLATAGHRLTYAGPPDDRRLADHHGLGFCQVEPSQYQQFLEADQRDGILPRLLHVRQRRERAARATGAASFARAVHGLAPDLVLINGEMHEHIIALAGARVPMALLNSFVSIWRRPGLPPPHALVQPGVGWKGTRAGNWLLWTALRLRKRRRAASQWVRRVGCDRVSILRRLAREAGVDFHQETDAGQWLIPFTFRRLPVLSLHALEFEFPHRPPDNVRYIGPMVLESRADGQEAVDRDRIEAVIARRQRSEGQRKLLYAGFGSAFSTDLSFVRRLIEAVDSRPDWELVVSLGSRATPHQLGPLPARVHAFSWVPQLDVLRHADVAVTHGGINTIDECVLAGVPVLVYCGSATDMAGTTSRVVFHGIGVAGDRRRDGMAQIRERIDTLLKESQFRHNVARLQQRYAAYAEARVAERAVELLLRERHTA